MNRSDLDKLVEEYSDNKYPDTDNHWHQIALNGCKSGASFVSNLLLPEIEKLKAENQMFREALEYYANRSNWTIRDDVADCLIDDSDYEKKHSFLTSGKRARQALSPQKKEGV